ncbi:MAG: abortive infection family protein [Acidimicrobiales bacterium]
MPGSDGRRLTRREVEALTYDWIGVEGGYLGDFTYHKHDRFWRQVCDIEVDTNAFPGTTRECFVETLLHAAPVHQAAVLRAILDDYPPLEPDQAKPKFRTPKLQAEIRGWIERLETGQAPVEVQLRDPSEVVRRALDDADALLRTSGSGAQSAVDRVHTAMHGYLIELCAEVGQTYDERPTMNVLLKALQAKHPLFVDVGPRSEEIIRVLRGMANILDALNPIRNNASVAHPNSSLVGEPEAWLLVNTVRTLLNYLEARLRLAPGSADKS